MHTWRALLALSCLAVASARGASSPCVPRPRARVVARAAPPTVVPAAPLPSLDVAAVRTHAVTVARGARLRVRHEGSASPVRAALRVGRETWLATPSGVLRYGDDLWRDPAHARPLGLVAGLPSPDALALAAAPGGVWVGTARGLAVVGRRTAARLAGQRVTALAPPFVGTWRAVLLDGVALAGSPAHVTALLRCRGALLVGTHDGGLWRRAGDGVFARVAGLPSTRVDALAGCAGDGPAHAATLRGLFAVRDGAASPVANIHTHVTAVADAGGALFVGRFGDGVLDAAHVRSVTAAGRVASLTWSAAHRALLVATDEGLAVLRDGVATPVALDEGPRGRVVALAASGDDLFAATFAHGLYARSGGRWRAVAGFDPRLSALAVDARGDLWVGSAGGLGRLARGASRVAAVRDPRGWFARHINALAVEGGTLRVFVYPGAVAVEGGRYRYLGATDATESVAPGSDYTKELGALSRATLFASAADGDATWFASAGGLLRAEGGGVRALTELGGALPDRTVHDVALRGGGVWALLGRAGLARWTPGGLDVWPLRWTAAPRGLVATREAWLVATEDRGLVRVAVGREGPRFTAWGSAEGLSGDAVTAVAETREGLWLGGLEGVDRVEDGGRALATEGGTQR